MGPLAVGIKIPKNIQFLLSRICNGLPNTTWLEPSDFIVILHQIGHVESSILLDINDKLAELRYHPLEISLHDVIIKHSKGNNGSIITEAKGDINLEALIKNIKNALKPLKLEKNAIPQLPPHTLLGYYNRLPFPRIGNFLEANAGFSSPNFIIKDLAVLSWETTAKRAFYLEHKSFSGDGNDLLEK